MPHGQLAVAALVTVLNIAIQAFATLVVVRNAHWMVHHYPVRWRYSMLVTVVGMTGILLTLAYLAEAGVWATIYTVIGVTKPEDAFYFAFVNFTTLGYGDILPEQAWRLMGPLTAANGMLMFGWSTAVIFAVLMKALEILRLD